MIEERKKYVTSDGTEFDTFNEAERYEVFNNKISDYCLMYLGEKSIIRDFSYIEHSVENVFMLIAKIILLLSEYKMHETLVKLLNFLLNDSLFADYRQLKKCYLELKNYRFNLNGLLSSVIYRIICIDLRTGFEFSSPVWANDIRENSERYDFDTVNHTYSLK